MRPRSCSERVGMIAWWSWTFWSFTTRPSGSLSRLSTYAAPVLGAPADQLGRGLDLADHVAGQVARVGARVGERLVLLVEALGGGQRATRREAVERVGVALQRRQVVQELRALALLLLLELRDLAGLAGDRLDDRGGRGLGREPLAAQVAARVRPVLRRLEARLHEPVGLGLEGADLLLAAGHQGQRGGLHAAERDGAVERGAQADAGRPGGVHG